MSDTFNCPICACTTPLLDKVILHDDTDHHTCKSCYFQWVRINSTCPFCRSTIYTSHQVRQMRGSSAYDSLQQSLEQTPLSNQNSFICERCGQTNRSQHKARFHNFAHPERNICITCYMAHNRTSMTCMFCNSSNDWNPFA